MARPKTQLVQVEQETRPEQLTGSDNTVVSRKRGRPKGSTNKTKVSRPDRTVQTEQGENSRYILHDMKLMNLPTIDLNNPEQMRKRINAYFGICSDDDIKPSIASLALSLGVGRSTLFNWLTGKTQTITNNESMDTLKKAYDTINSYYEHMMNNGKINPVAGIFLMKNNMGYKDTTDYIVTTNNEKTESITDITERSGLLSE